ncbi:hypothetical protein [Yoonia sp. 208BN28-4]|uniref:hypothetical protein n=1 Tax=Yoonia sp. 208BN28-4 TaxID=3126505 RepID=UPI0030A0ABF9
MWKFAALALFLPNVVTAQDVFGTMAGCARAAGMSDRSDGAITWFVGDRIDFHESSCAISGSTPVGSGATVVTVQCTGEGETWENYYMIETTSDADRFVIYPEEFPDLRSELNKCF